MAAKNDITGDSIRSKSSSTFSENWDRIWGKKSPQDELADLDEDISRVRDQLEALLAKRVGVVAKLNYMLEFGE